MHFCLKIHVLKLKNLNREKYSCPDVYICTVVKFCSDFLDDLKVLECAQSFFMPHHRRVIGHSPCQKVELVIRLFSKTLNIGVIIMQIKIKSR